MGIYRKSEENSAANFAGCTDFLYGIFWIMQPKFQPVCKTAQIFYYYPQFVALHVPEDSENVWLISIADICLFILY
jgi:hypothetical protein